jgi:Ca2+-binding RTX toxin-like protein
MRNPSIAAIFPSPFEALEPRRLFDGSSGYAENFGVVNLADFNRLAANFGQSATGVEITPDDWANLANSVPTLVLDHDGTLYVTGNQHVNHFTITADTIAQQQSQFPATPIRRLHLDAGAGDDVVTMQVSLPATIIGGRGNDRITAGGRADHVSGGAGSDVINGGGGDDVIEGLAGDDNIDGSAGTDLLLGGDGRDSLYGMSGADTLRGGAGDDNLLGHDGNDLLYGDAGTDYLDGHWGHDRYKAADGVGAADLILRDRRGGRDVVLSMDSDDREEMGMV